MAAPEKTIRITHSTKRQGVVNELIIILTAATRHAPVDTQKTENRRKAMMLIVIPASLSRGDDIVPFSHNPRTAKAVPSNSAPNNSHTRREKMNSIHGDGQSLLRLWDLMAAHPVRIPNTTDNIQCNSERLIIPSAMASALSADASTSAILIIPRLAGENTGFQFSPRLGFEKKTSHRTVNAIIIIVLVFLKLRGSSNLTSAGVVSRV